MHYRECIASTHNENSNTSKIIHYKLRIAKPNLSSKSALPFSLDKVPAILPYLLAESLIRSGASFY